MKTPGLRAARDKRLVTIRELAAAAGVSTNTISRLERGEEGYVTTIRKLARALQCKAADLTGFDSGPTKAGGTGA